MDNGRPFILVVDDDPEIRRLVAAFLAREGLEVDTVEDAAAMDAAMARRRPDLVVLDLMMPGEDGLSVCRRLRATGGPAILMLTAKSDEIDRVVGLELGADDYLAKPFGPRELLARIRAVLRRTAARAADGDAGAVAARRFAFDSFRIDLDARRLTDVSGTTLQLTSGEFNLLACFVERPRRVLSRDQILDRLHGRGAEPFDRTVDMLVSRLRRKLATVNPDVELISTVRNGGYVFTASVRPAP
ncbi:MAG: response regulator transcription factor [Pseudomonadota bacterium]